MKIALVSGAIIWTPLKVFQIFKRYLPPNSEIKLFTTDVNALKFPNQGIVYANTDEKLVNKIKQYSPDIIQINKLKNKGFSKFRIYKHNWLTYHLSEHGTIYAEK